MCAIIKLQAGKSESYYILEDDMENLQVEDLIAGRTYDIDLRVGSFEDPYDLGLSIYDDEKYETLLMTLDSAGTAPEIGQFTPSRDGTFYLLVYNNDNDGVFIDVTIKDHLTSEEMDIGYYFSSYDPGSFIWIWIMVGIGGGLVIILISLIPVFFILKSRKTIKTIQNMSGITQGATTIEDAKAAPYTTKITRSGKKRICPYCNVKIPNDEKLVQCPYCNAPLSEEE
ncbi:MAG: hypothetical protein FK734_14190 [Asgard group archaeon]|nr:hypothetical protein [Asgard group archaeon]